MLGESSLTLHCSQGERECRAWMTSASASKQTHMPHVRCCWLQTVELDWNYEGFLNHDFVALCQANGLELYTIASTYHAFRFNVSTRGFSWQWM